MSKFKKKITKAIKTEELEKRQQEQLKGKYHIPEEDTRIVVEKNNMIKFTVKTAGYIFRILVNIIIFFFAVAGAAAIIFPESRNVLESEIIKAYEQFKLFMQ